MDTDGSSQARLPAHLFSQLDARDAALWLIGNGDGADSAAVVSLSRLPWSVVLTERSDEPFLSDLDSPEPVDDPLVRRRGLVHLVDASPSDVILPPRHLAILLMNGRGAQRQTGLAALTRRLTMLQELRRRSPRQLVLVVDGAFAIPGELEELWADGYRTTLLFVSNDPEAPALIAEWRQRVSTRQVDLLPLSPPLFGQKLSHDYLKGRDGTLVVRMRNEKGGWQDVETNGLDDPERPLLGGYDLPGAEALVPLMPSDLTVGEVDGFFADPASSWRPYAAGMTWERAPSAWNTLRYRLRLLDRLGAEENRILYVTAEPGSGTTTFLRDLAWRASAEGYPALVAGRGTVTSSGLEMSSFLTRLVNVGRELRIPTETSR